MRRRVVFVLTAVVTLCHLSGCSAPRPVLYPNDAFNRAGKAAADHDIEECMRRAEEYVSSGRAAKVAGDTAMGAGVGAAAGAAGGAVVGDPGRGAAIGAATGGAGSFVRGIFGSREPSPVYKSFVDRCLQEKGYQPIGWQ